VPGERRAGARTWVSQMVSRPLRLREVAWLLSCSESYCRKIVFVEAGEAPTEGLVHLLAHHADE